MLYYVPNQGLTLKNNVLQVEIACHLNLEKNVRNKVAAALINKIKQIYGQKSPDSPVLSVKSMNLDDNEESLIKLEFDQLNQTHVHQVQELLKNFNIDVTQTPEAPFFTQGLLGKIVSFFYNFVFSSESVDYNFDIPEGYEAPEFVTAVPASGSTKQIIESTKSLNEPYQTLCQRQMTRKTELENLGTREDKENYQDLIKQANAINTEINSSNINNTLPLTSKTTIGFIQTYAIEKKPFSKISFPNFDQDRAIVLKILDMFKYFQELANNSNVDFLEKRTKYNRTTQVDDTDGYDKWTIKQRDALHSSKSTEERLECY